MKKVLKKILRNYLIVGGFIMAFDGFLKISGKKFFPNPYWPVGSIYISVSSENPSKWFGGTWGQIAKGRTLVGVDPNDDDFKTVKKTGGSKYIQEHYHRNVVQYSGEGNDTGEIYSLPNAWSGTYRDRSWIDNRNIVSNVQTGNSGNLQPYFTCYIWQRTA